MGTAVLNLAREATVLLADAMAPRRQLCNTAFVNGRHDVVLR
jgi:hypothetical protein